MPIDPIIEEGAFVEFRFHVIVCFSIVPLLLPFITSLPGLLFYNYYSPELVLILYLNYTVRFRTNSYPEPSHARRGQYIRRRGAESFQQYAARSAFGRRGERPTHQQTPPNDP